MQADESKLNAIKNQNIDNKLFLATATTWNYDKTKYPYLWEAREHDERATDIPEAWPAIEWCCQTVRNQSYLLASSIEQLCTHDLQRVYQPQAYSSCRTAYSPESTHT